MTDGKQHTDDLLSTTTRTVQPFSPEADPFVQGETLGAGSKGCRNNLECRSRKLAKKEIDGVAEVQRSNEDKFTFVNQKQGSCAGHDAEEFYRFPSE